MAFENGIVKDGTVASGWVDVAAVHVITGTGCKEGEKAEESVAWSARLEIPRSAVDACLDPKSLEDSSPVATKNWSELKDPHKELAGVPRRVFLADALAAWWKGRCW